MTKQQEVALKEVEEILDQKLRAYVASHGGYIEVEEVDRKNGIVFLTMEGACSSCPAALITLRLGVTATLREHLPWLKKVELLNEPVEPDFNIKL